MPSVRFSEKYAQKCKAAHRQTLVWVATHERHIKPFDMPYISDYLVVRLISLILVVFKKCHTIHHENCNQSNEVEIEKNVVIERRTCWNIMAHPVHLCSDF